MSKIQQAALVWALFGRTEVAPLCQTKHLRQPTEPPLIPTRVCSQSSALLLVDLQALQDEHLNLLLQLGIEQGAQVRPRATREQPQLSPMQVGALLPK